jgi:hypothetical protein
MLARRTKSYFRGPDLEITKLMPFRYGMGDIGILFLVDILSIAGIRKG